MTRILTGSLMAVWLLTVVSAQASLTGKWEGATPNGTPVVLDLSATGTSLTGTVTHGEQVFKITDGTVSKDSFAFKVTHDQGTDALSGTLAGGEVRVWLDRQGPESTIVFKRATK